MSARVAQWAVLILAGCITAQALAYEFNVDFTNTTGQTCDGFQIQLQGNVEVTNWYTGWMNPFPEHDRWFNPFDETTWVSFAGASVEPNETIHIGFDVGAGKGLDKAGSGIQYAAQWTSGTQTVGAQPVPGVRYSYDPMTRRIGGTVNNDVGPRGIQVYDFCYQITSYPIPLNDLMWDNMTWTPLPGGPYVLLPGMATPTIVIENVSPADYVSLGWRTTWDDGTCLVRAIYLQHAGDEAIPAVSSWGLVVMTLLVLASGAIVLSRRGGRRPVAA